MEDSIEYWLALADKSNIQKALVDDDLVMKDTSKMVVEELRSTVCDDPDDLESSRQSPLSPIVVMESLNHLEYIAYKCQVENAIIYL